MSNDLRFQRTARAWLELGPIEAPADVIQAAFLEIETTPQERDLGVPWTFRPVPTLARALVAAAVVIGLVAGGAILLQRSTDEQIGGPPPSPVIPSAAPSAVGLAATDLSSTFVSTHYGYTLPVGPTWTTHQATLTWTGPDNTTPVTDDISLPDTDLYFNGASEALAPGQSFDEWLATFQPPGIATLECYGGQPADWPSRDLGGHAWRWQQACQAAVAMTEAGGRAYVFTCGGCLPPSDPSTGRVASDGVNQTNQLFVRMLSAVQLQPDAVPSPSPAPSLDSEYRSDQHGYTLNYPYGWALMQRATAPGPADRMPVPDNPGLDVLGDASVRLSVTSLPMAKGVSADTWVHTFCDLTHTLWSMPCDQGPAVWEQVPLANGDAWLTVNGDSAAQFPQPDSRLFLATAVSGGRAYEIRLEGPAERDLFLAILASMRLDPAAAVEGTAAP